MRRNIQAIGGAAAAMAVALALAGAAEAGWFGLERRFDQTDIDKNGKLSLAEIQPKVNGRFGQMDLDGDGKVTTQEIEARQRQFMERTRNRTLARFDTNKDGVITKDEFNGSVGSMFTDADLDKDGGITPGEALDFGRSRYRAGRAQTQQQ